MTAEPRRSRRRLLPIARARWSSRSCRSPSSSTSSTWRASRSCTSSWPSGSTSPSATPGRSRWPTAAFMAFGAYAVAILGQRGLPVRARARALGAALAFGWGAPRRLPRAQGQAPLPGHGHPRVQHHGVPGAPELGVPDRGLVRDLGHRPARLGRRSRSAPTARTTSTCWPGRRRWCASAYWILGPRDGAGRSGPSARTRCAPRPLGVSLRNYKLMAFAIGAAYAGDRRGSVRAPPRLHRPRRLHARPVDPVPDDGRHGRARALRGAVHRRDPGHGPARGAARFGGPLPGHLRAGRHPHDAVHAQGPGRACGTGRSTLLAGEPGRARAAGRAAGRLPRAADGGAACRSSRYAA